MELTVITFPADNYFHELAELTAEQNLVYYASEAAEEMGFGDMDEFHDAVKRAMELCLTNGMPLKNNFKRVFKSTPAGVVYDWKLSVIAWELVKLNGNSSNPRVAEKQINLLRNIA